MITVPVPVTVTTEVALVTVVPPGPATVILSNTGTDPAYVGVTDAVSSTNGFPLPAGATVTVPGFPGSAATNLYAISSGTAVVGALISTTG